MPRLIDRITGPASDDTLERAGMAEVIETWQSGTETLPTDFRSYVRDGLKSNSVVFALHLARLMLFTEVKFAYRDRADGEWFPPPFLLQNPRRMLAGMIQDVDLTGNAFIYKPAQGQWQRLRPDWVKLYTNRREVITYEYTVGGPYGGGTTKTILPEEMAHWAPIPDPESPFQGMSWMTPIAREIAADREMTKHRAGFFRRGATPNFAIVSKKALNEDQRRRLQETFKDRYEGTSNAYRTLLLEGGDIEVVSVGSNLRQLDFSTIQGAGETRIAAAAGVPPVLVGFTKGLESATYSNYLHAMRRFADSMLRPLWGSVTDSLRSLVPQYAGRYLEYDDRRIPALQADAKDDAEILYLKAQTIDTLFRAGYDQDAIAKAVMNNDIEHLQHTGAQPTTLYQEGDPGGNDSTDIEQDATLEGDDNDT